jgi:GTPase SAR1 family protein
MFWNMNNGHTSYCYSYSCCSVEDSDRVSEELQRADSVILTYACDRPKTLQNISTFWLPLLRKLEVVISFSCFCISSALYLAAHDMFVFSFLENLCLTWIFEIHEQVKVPVIVVGCKLDLLDENQYVRVEPMMSPLMQKFCEIESSLMQKFGEIESSLMQKFNEIESSLMQKFCEIESCIECSAYRNTEVSFIYTTAIKLIIFFKSAILYLGFDPYNILV